MYASSEKQVLNKNYIDNCFDRRNLWSYMDKNDYRKQITFKWVPDIKKYSFSFPMNKREYNYVIYFDTQKEAEEYVEFILKDYLE